MSASQPRPSPPAQTGDPGFRILLRLVSKKIYKAHEKALRVLSVGQTVSGSRNPEAVLPTALHTFVREAKTGITWPRSLADCCARMAMKG